MSLVAAIARSQNGRSMNASFPSRKGIASRNGVLCSEFPIHSLNVHIGVIRSFARR